MPTCLSSVLTHRLAGEAALSLVPGLGAGGPGRQPWRAIMTVHGHPQPLECQGETSDPLWP